MRPDNFYWSLYSKYRSLPSLLAFILLLIFLATVLPAVWAGDNGGGALDFPGGGLDYVDIDDVGLNLSSFTIEFWIKPDSTANDRRILGNITGTSTDYAIRFYNDRIQIWPSSQGASPGWHYVSTSSIPTNQWTHIAVVHSSGTATGYVNGIQESTGVSNLPSGADDIGLGARLLLSGGSSFDGQMDEVRLWNTTRSQAEIQATMHVQLSGSETDLLAYYRLDGDVSDSSGSNNVGTLVGSPSWVTASTAPIGDSIVGGQDEISALWSPVDPSSSGGLFLTNVSFLRGIGDDIVFGHNNLVGNTDQDLPSDWPATGARWRRVWYCDLYDEPTVTGGTVDVTFDYAAAGMGSFAPAGVASNYRLLERLGTSGVFSEIATASSYNTSIGTVTFSGVSTDSLCSYITLGTRNNNASPTAVILQSASALPVVGSTWILLLGFLALGAIGLLLLQKSRQ